MVANDELDTAAAAWIRNIIVLAIAILVAVALGRKVPTLIFSLPIIWWGFIYAIQAVSWTWVLKHIEINATSVSFAMLPLAFLPIDLFVRHEHMTILQILGVLTLVAGGFIFFARKDLRKNMTKRHVLGFLALFLFDAIIFGSEGYIFKSYYDAQSLAPYSFMVNGMFYMCGFLTLMFGAWALYLGSKLNMTGAWAYAQGSSIAKWADYGNIFFSLNALTMASVSQVAAMKVIQPLVLLVVTFTMQRHLDVELREELARETLIQKIAGMCCIVAGSFLIR